MMAKKSAVILIGVLIIGLIVGLLLIPTNKKTEEHGNVITTPISIPKGQEVATFAGGCFWCVEAVFQETSGVVEVISGYAGGKEENPTYEQVYTEQTGHRESIQIFYNPDEISYSELLDIYWRNIDPTDDGGQFVDRGHSYTTAIFYHNDKQKELAQSSKLGIEELATFDEAIVTKILPFTTFYKAEDYHQDFYLKSSSRYEQYKSLSGREEFKEFVWEEIEMGEK